MKTKITAISIALLLASSAHAESANEVCEVLHETATMVMELRQEGLPMPKMMQIADSDLARTIVQEAYEVSQYHSDEVKSLTVQKFANKIAAYCYKAMQ